MGRSATGEDLRRILEPVINTAGLDLEAVDVSPAGKRRLLRVVVDQDGGVGLDDVAEVSRLISAALDDAEPLGSQPYVLEVTSPGVDRPLSERRHWRRAVGRLVETKVDGDVLLGRVTAVGDEGVELAVSGAPRVLAWAELAPGHVQVEFNRPANAKAPGAGEEG